MLRFATGPHARHPCGCRCLLGSTGWVRAPTFVVGDTPADATRSRTLRWHPCPPSQARLPQLRNVLLAWSCCPTSQCSLGVWLVRSNSGTREPSGCTGSPRTRRSGAAATLCCRPCSRSTSPICCRSLSASVTGPVNCAIPAETAAKSLLTAGCCCSVTKRCSRSIVM